MCEDKTQAVVFLALGKNLKKCRLGKLGGRLLTYCLSHGDQLPTDSAVFDQHKPISDVTPCVPAAVKMNT